jgi:hypothetical protein
MDRVADQTSLTESSLTESSLTESSLTGSSLTGSESPQDEAAGAVPSGTVDSLPPGADGSLPPGTGPEVPPALGTSETMTPVLGVHTPDVGEGGRDFDTAATPLPGRTDHGRT